MGGKNILKRVRILFSWWGQRIVEGFPGGAVVKNLPTSAGDAGDASLTLGLGRSPGGGNGNPL